MLIFKTVYTSPPNFPTLLSKIIQSNYHNFKFTPTKNFSCHGLTIDQAILSVLGAAKSDQTFARGIGAKFHFRLCNLSTFKATTFRKTRFNNFERKLSSALKDKMCPIHFETFRNLTFRVTARLYLQNIFLSKGVHTYFFLLIFICTSGHFDV